MRMFSRLSQSNILIPSMIVIAMLAVAAGFFVSVKQAQQKELELVRQEVNVPGLFWPNPKNLGQFEVVDHTGQIFNQNNLSDKWSVIFFGFTHCPDICPVTMSMLGQIYPSIDEKVNNLQVLFVSVDPERDTPEKMADYVNYFNENFVGLSGNLIQVETLTKQLGVAYFHHERQGDNYLVDHSASLFVIDPKGRLVGKISPPHTPEIIQNNFLDIQTFINEQG